MKIIKPLDINLNINKILGKNEPEEENKTLKSMLEKIKGAEKIAILTHESPDGDAIGSSLAMYLSLKQIGKKTEVYIPVYSRLFNFLPDASEIKDNLSEDVYDLIIALDCSDLKRLEGKEYFEDAKETLVIDHHGTNSMFGDINYVNYAAPACCQVLISILDNFEINITKEIGTCLVTGIMTDTGGFQYQLIYLKLLQEFYKLELVQILNYQKKFQKEWNYCIMEKLHFLT